MDAARVGAGEVLRVDRRTGRVTEYTDGLPTKAFPTDIGGPVDVSFVGRTAYVLVTPVSGRVLGVGGGPFGDPDARNGIDRLGREVNSHW